MPTLNRRSLHLGNYLGAIRQFVALQDHSRNECHFFVADLHAMTTIHDGKLLRSLSLQVATDYLALGLDSNRAVIYRQSDVPQVTELAWMLSTLTPMGLLQRGHSYKDKLARCCGTPASSNRCCGQGANAPEPWLVR